MVGQILLIQEDHWLARRCRPAANHGQPSSYDSGGYETLETVNIHVCADHEPRECHKCAKWRCRIMLKAVCATEHSCVFMWISSASQEEARWIYLSSRHRQMRQDASDRSFLVASDELWEGRTPRESQSPQSISVPPTVCVHNTEHEDNDWI